MTKFPPVSKIVKQFSRHLIMFAVLTWLGNYPCFADVFPGNPAPGSWAAAKNYTLNTPAVTTNLLNSPSSGTLQGICQSVGLWSALSYRLMTGTAWVGSHVFGLNATIGSTGKDSFKCNISVTGNGYTDGLTLFDGNCSSVVSSGVCSLFGNPGTGTCTTYTCGYIRGSNYAATYNQTRYFKAQNGGIGDGYADCQKFPMDSANYHTYASIVGGGAVIGKIAGAIFRKSFSCGGVQGTSYEVRSYPIYAYDEGVTALPIDQSAFSDQDLQTTRDMGLYIQSAKNKMDALNVMVSTTYLSGTGSPFAFPTAGNDALGYLEHGVYLSTGSGGYGTVPIPTNTVTGVSTFNISVVISTVTMRPDVDNVTTLDGVWSAAQSISSVLGISSFAKSDSTSAIMGIDIVAISSGLVAQTGLKGVLESFIPAAPATLPVATFDLNFPIFGHMILDLESISLWQIFVEIVRWLMIWGTLIGCVLYLIESID